MNNDTSQSTLQVQGFTPYAQVPKWILRAGANLSHGAVRLYGVIMTYADNNTKVAFPSRETLASDLGMKPRSISSYTKELEEFGALQVTRRRNKRTGNFYANHYVLVFNEPGAIFCTPPDAAEGPITTPTILNIDSPPFTSDKSDATFTPEQSSRTNNPGNLSEDQRRVLRKKLQRVGELISQGHKFYDDRTQDAWWNFTEALEDHLPNYADIADNVDNGKWTVTAKVADPYQAGIELNKIIHTGNM